MAVIDTTSIDMIVRNAILPMVREHLNLKDVSDVVLDEIITNWFSDFNYDLSKWRNDTASLVEDVRL